MCLGFIWGLLLQKRLKERGKEFSSPQFEGSFYDKRAKFNLDRQGVVVSGTPCVRNTID